MESIPLIRSIIERLLAEAGQPVAGNTLAIPERRRATVENRVIMVGSASVMGDRYNAGFSFVTTFGLARDGIIAPGYLVFPRPIPPALRGDHCASTHPGWEDENDVFSGIRCQPVGADRPVSCIAGPPSLRKQRVDAELVAPVGGAGPIDRPAAVR
jgi:hypothetical protein